MKSMGELFDFLNVIVYFLISFLFTLITLYSRKFLKNLEENEKLAASLIFLNPKVPKCFEIFAIIFVIFAVASLVSPIYRAYFRSSVVISIISTCIVLFTFIYFFRTLYNITKSEEYGA
ncbi:MAG: hypothetical protein QW412_02410 [Candidatus Aenigmatarchaeota archaeon]